MKAGERTAVLGYIFAGLIIAVIALRLILRKARRHRWDVSDYLCQATGLVVVALIPIIALEISWGSVNSILPGTVEHNLTKEDIQRRVIGSKLTLASRSLYATYLWLQKCSILSLKERIIDALPSALSHYLIWSTWTLLAITFVVVQVATFTECHPFHEYWQINPPSYSHCGYAARQLYAFIFMNLFTDAVLLFLPMPWIFKVERTKGEKWSLAALFLIHIVMIPVEILRLPLTPEYTLQHRRLTMAYIEGFLECIIANGPIIYSLLHSDQLPMGFTNISQASTIGFVASERPSFETLYDEAAQKGFPNLSNKVVNADKFDAELKERFGNKKAGS